VGERTRYASGRLRQVGLASSDPAAAAAFSTSLSSWGAEGCRRRYRHGRDASHLTHRGFRERPAQGVPSRCGGRHDRPGIARDEKPEPEGE
jgi:hypothetical protein